MSHKATNRLLIGHLLGFDLRSYRDRIALAARFIAERGRT